MIGASTPIMAAPRFDRAMYQALDDYNRDWLVPGLGQDQADRFRHPALTNPVFTETFLVGLSDEMGRELFWRGYPTDQRGTYFYRFWNENARRARRSDDPPVSRTPRGSQLRKAPVRPEAASCW